MEDFELNCPERDEVVTNESELAYDDKKSIDGLNWEAGVPLDIDTPYLMVPQLNTGRKYRNPDENADNDHKKLTSKRFYGVQMTDDMGDITRTCRTIGISAIRGMYVGKTSDGEAPKFDVAKNNEDKLRAKNVKYYHACSDTSFIKGDTNLMRAKIVRPVILIPKSRGGVYTLEYDQRTKDVKTAGSPKKAVCSENDRFYIFEIHECTNSALVEKATKALEQRSDFYHA